MQQRGLPRVVQTEEENFGILMMQPQTGQHRVKPIEDEHRVSETRYSPVTTNVHPEKEGKPFKGSG